MLSNTKMFRNQLDETVDRNIPSLLTFDTSSWICIITNIELFRGKCPFLI